MAIDLLNSFLQRKQNISSNQKGAASQTAQAMSGGQRLPHNIQVMRAIRALQAGQTIQGEVVSVKGNEVQLAILKDVIIDAKLAGSMNLTPGLTMPFQVKANNSQGLSLIPLFTNIAADPNALKALDMAQIPVNDRSLEMVQTLMEKGMPIDKQSVQEMYREVIGFKDAPVKDIVSLHRLELPVNRENLAQFSSYQNNQHYLKDTFSQIGSAIGNHLDSLVSQGDIKGALKMMNDLQQLFQGKQELMQEISVDEPSVHHTFSGKTVEMSYLLPETGEGTQGNLSGETVVFEKAMPVIITEDTLIKGENALPKREIAQPLIETEIPEKVIAAELNSDSVTGEKIVSEAENKTQSNGLAAMSKESIEWKDLADTLLKENTPGKVSRLFEKIWNREIAENWMLEPEEVANKKNVKDYFEKLSGQIKQLEKLFDDGSAFKSPAMKAIQNTASNLDFMNQLHQMHAYIQLPLKMADKNAHGELYVFTNKKNFTKQDGKVTALLHLDMEHLGRMDVYVALEQKKVNTNFYLEKEEYLEFLEAHMELLTSRLNKRGYACDIKTTLRSPQEETVIETMEKQQGPSVLLSTQAFDMRA